MYPYKEIPIKRRLPTWLATKRAEENKTQWVPVLSSTGKPLMPCHPARARELVKKGKATKRYLKGIFCIQLTEREDGYTQPIAIGVDPGSKMNGYCVKSGDHTYVNIQQNAKKGQAVKDKVEGRANARRARRGRKTPCRQPRFSNRGKKNWIPPSTFSRWQHIYNTVKLLSRLYPITHAAIEDVSTELKEGDKRRNSDFSPIMAGKNWLYGKIMDEGYELKKLRGQTTAKLRRDAGVYKDPNKLDFNFHTHAVDAWVLANSIVGGHLYPEYIGLTKMKRYECCRRQLHLFNPDKGGVRKRYGGTTLPNNLRKGTLVKYTPKKAPRGYLTLVTGHSEKTGYSLNVLDASKRYAQNGKLERMQILHQTRWLITPPYHHRGYPSKKRSQRDLHHAPDSVRTHYGYINLTI